MKNTRLVYAALLLIALAPTILYGMQERLISEQPTGAAEFACRACFLGPSSQKEDEMSVSSDYRNYCLSPRSTLGCMCFSCLSSGGLVLSGKLAENMVVLSMGGVGFVISGAICGFSVAECVMEME